MWLLLLLLPAISALNYKCQNDQVLVVQSFGNDTIRMHCQHLDLCGYQKLRCDYDETQPSCGGLMNFVAHVNQVSATSPVEHTCCNLFNPRPPHMVPTHIGNDCFIYELPDGSTVAKPKEDSTEEGSPLAVLKSPADIPEQIDGVTGYRLRLFLLKNKAPPTLLVKGIERRLDGYRVTICRPRCNSHTVVGDQTSDNAGEWKAISWSSWTSSSWSTWAKSVFNNNGQSRTREAIEGSSPSPIANREGSSGVNVNVDSSGNNNNKFGASDSGEPQRGGFNRATVNGGEPVPGNINITIHTDGRDGPAPSATANAHTETHIHNHGGKDDDGEGNVKSVKSRNGNGLDSGDNDEDLIGNRKQKGKNSHGSGDDSGEGDDESSGNTGNSGNSGNSGKGKNNGGKQNGGKKNNKNNNGNGANNAGGAGNSGENEVDSVKVQSRGGDNDGGDAKPSDGSDESDGSDGSDGANGKRGNGNGQKKNGGEGEDGTDGGNRGNKNKDNNGGEGGKKHKKPAKNGKDGDDGLDGPNADPDADHETVGKDHHKGKNGKDGKGGRGGKGGKGNGDGNGNGDAEEEDGKDGKPGKNGKKGENKGKDADQNGKNGKNGNGNKKDKKADREGNGGEGKKHGGDKKKPDAAGNGKGKNRNGGQAGKGGSKDAGQPNGKNGKKEQDSNGAKKDQSGKAGKGGQEKNGKTDGADKKKTDEVVKTQNRAAEAESEAEATTSRIATTTQEAVSKSEAKFEQTDSSEGAPTKAKAKAQKTQKTSDTASKKPAAKPAAKPKAQATKTAKTANRTPQSRATAARETQTDEKPVRAQAAPVLKAESTGAKMNCFSADTTVKTPFGEKRMDELQVGDYVIVPSSKNTVKYERIELFYHRQPETKAQFVVLFTESGKRLALTPLHLIPFGECAKMKQSLASSQEGIEDLVYGSRFAKSVTVDECVVTVDEDGTVFADRVVKVGRQYSTGIYSPMTVEGTLVADGVLASCFSQLESHSVQKVIFDFFYHVNDFFGLGFGETVATQDIPSMVRYVHQLSHYVLPFAKY